MERVEYPLLYCGEVVGTAIFDDNGVMHATLDPDLISEEEVDAIFAHDDDFYASFSINREE